MALRNVTKSAIPITNPNKPAPEANKDGDISSAIPIADLGAGANGVHSDTSPKGVNAAIVNHPSSTVGPIVEAPRPTAAKPPGNNWSSLDMGGIQIKNLSPSSGLFSFSFLINLYLNHNALTSIPPEIAKLRHLELLDVSGNNLLSVPPELGMLTQLK